MSFKTIDTFQNWKSFEEKSPFLEKDFLQTLEDSQSLGESRGQWVHSKVAKDWAIPLFIKNHSYGEYIFDWDWANAYQQYQTPYYPKLVSAIPYTPATTPKLLGNKLAAANSLIQIQQEAKLEGFSGLHYLYLPENEISYFEETNHYIRHSFQFHWRNKNYSSFETFLSHLKRNKRKAIKRERKSIVTQQIEIKQITGQQLTTQHAIEMYIFYNHTIEKKKAIPYLSKDFFIKIFTRMKNSILYIQAKKNQVPIAGSLFYFNSEVLYGRYWGSLSEVPALHFELCYYQGIEFVIKNGIRTFEAGAQGEHKIMRGFLPTLTFSAHKLFHSQFNKAIGEFIEQEKEQIKNMFNYYEQMNPFNSP